MTKYTKWRNVIGFERFPEYLKYMKAIFPQSDLHHILGSTTAKKFTDALVYPVSHEFHLSEVEKKKAHYFEKYLFGAIVNFTNWAVDQGFTEILGGNSAEDVAEYIGKVHKFLRRKKT